jgi:pullulanase
VDPSKPIKNLTEHARLSPAQMKTHKLAALFLMTCQGSVMLHAGQEFGRSKVIAPNKKPDTYPGFLDHNSYNKDDETNWINYDQLHMNQELVDYYAGLIAIRKKYACLRKTEGGKPAFLDTPDHMLVAFQVHQADGIRLLVVLNCHRGESFTLSLSSGPWHVLADAERASHEPFRQISSDTLTLDPCTGIILIRQ